MPYTVKNFENLKPKESRYEFADDKQPGLRLVVQPTGARTWIVRYRQDGKQHKLTLGSFESVSLGDARDAARKARGKVASGSNPAAEKMVERARVRTEAAATKKASEDDFEKRWMEYKADYLENLKSDLTPNYIEDVTRAFEKIAVPEFKGKLLGALKQNDVRKLLARVSRDRGPHAANKLYAFLNHFFGHFEKKRDEDDNAILTNSPMRGLDKPGREVKRKRVLTDDEIRWLWKACEEDHKRTFEAVRDRKRLVLKSSFGAFLQLTLLNATRRDEFRCAVDAEIERRTGLFTIPAKRTKNKREHSIPLAALSLKILAGVPRVEGKAGFIFSTTGKTAMSGLRKAKERITAAMLRMAREEAKKRGDNPDKVSIPAWRIHDLRRTARTGFSRLRISGEIAERCINHVSNQADTEEVYNQHRYLEEKKEAFAAWANLVQSIVSGKIANVVPIRGAA
ncbi:MAG TPA: integrase arm-type DNA-binding domain-containing protein [Xanthobacteraceae bacterium]|nr:integrase arm-type DNA-binding domain-containing protein [Xanthobacteraceae bacterium]